MISQRKVKYVMKFMRSFVRAEICWSNFCRTVHIKVDMLMKERQHEYVVVNTVKNLEVPYKMGNSVTT
jgi:hypothetical protein